MIQEIFIRDLGVIREARLEFTSGLNVISGETGAGKTMVLTALGLLLGERADSGSVRTGQSQTFVEGRMRIADSQLQRRISELGAAIEDDDVILNRTVSSEGKSRASIGGASVPVSVIGEIGSQLVVVHGQADQIRLKSSLAQREALDAFAENEDLLESYQQVFHAWQSAKQTLENLNFNAASIAAELEAAKLAVEEISTVNPESGEDIRLADLAGRLTNIEGLRLAASSSHEFLSSENESTDAIGLISQARKLLEHEAANDSVLGALAERLSEASFQLRDISGELASYLSALELDSDMSLDQVQQRRSELNGLSRKYGPTTDDVLAFRDQANARLLELDNSDSRIEELQSEIVELENRAITLAGELSDSRILAAGKLAMEVTSELRGLAMADSSLVVQVSPAGELTSSGADQVSILLSSYQGAEPRPLGKGASGGEISRIMLAIEVVLAKNSNSSTFIFDEVDAGVGGAAAIEVGRRLARLAKQTQVIVVTHLAQVAAFADRHLRVLKSSNENITQTDVVLLEESDRLGELTRMLSGLSGSASGQEHAAELMSLAKKAGAN